MKKCIFALGLSIAALFAAPLCPAAEQQRVWPTASDYETVIIETQTIGHATETAADSSVSIVPTYPLEEIEQSSDNAEADQSVWLPADDETVIIETEPQPSDYETLEEIQQSPSKLHDAETDQSVWPTSPERVIMDASAQEPDAALPRTQAFPAPGQSRSTTVRKIMPQQQEKSLWPTAPVKNRNTPPGSANSSAAEETVLFQHNSDELDFPPPAAQGGKDAVIDTVKEAVRQYRNKDFAGAISNLDYAAHLIRQKKSELLKDLLPEPFYGWQADTPESQSLGIAVFGGGSTVSRDYSAPSGAAVSIEIVSDSPVLQSIIMMLNNPLFAGASGGNLQTIKRQRAMIKYDQEERSGEINIVVANRFIVTVKGKKIDLVWLLRYAEAIDFETLAKN